MCLSFSCNISSGLVRIISQFSELVIKEYRKISEEILEVELNTNT